MTTDETAASVPVAEGGCGLGKHVVSQVGDAEWRCWRCGADQGVMEREEEDASCPTTTPESHLLGEFPMTCYRCHLEADS